MSATQLSTQGDGIPGHGERSITPEAAAAAVKPTKANDALVGSFL